MRFNRRQFFDGYRTLFGGMAQQQVTGLERLLGNIESDPHIPDNMTGLYWAAYILATVKRETAHTFTPIHEYGSKKYFISRYGGQTRKGRELGNDTPEEGYDYAGKGDVQTTGEANYEKAEVALRYEYPELVADFERRTGKTFDLTVGDQAGDKSDPQNILDPAISYAVMSYGMRTGMFTGRKLGQYTTGKVPDYLGMRAIVNGYDHDDEIAADARKFEKILRAALEDEEIDAIVNNIGKPTASADALPAVTPPFDAPVAEQPAVESPQAGLEPPGTLPPAEQPPTIQNAEQIINTGDTAAATQDVNIPASVTAPEPYQGVGFWAVIKRDLAAATGGNIGFESLSTYAQQASGWPEWVIAILSKVAIGALIATAGYFIFRVIHFLADTWKKNQKVQLEADVNTNTARRDVRWI